MRWFREFRQEWKARRQGAKAMKSDVYRAARHIVGPTGNFFSNAWDEFENGREAYLKSFDPRVPRSIFVTQQEATREHIPIPLVERCIEDWGKDPEVESLPDLELPE